ncbi:diguanylate cyclase (GGDEF)-like protein [Paenibacillus forsythiae]|uniref:Diguanylate cyclase (GGDEF)-like protein n=1 Tax=Paenibacillus forsythiae TaxID=365616 RepID=A0ABU3H9W7_9BACL|nr:diguanylate cyclase [Paenibacillus forsythiae]MDT3427261.1 diguanylate cyclase (GGDEF)-like protein [Paenibacillus forsythiae]
MIGIIIALLLPACGQKADWTRLAESADSGSFSMSAELREANLSFAPESGQLNQPKTRGYATNEQPADFLPGIYYGMMLAMALYNSFLYVSIRDRVYLYFGLFVVFFTAMQAACDGLAYLYLWPGHSAWELKSGSVFVVLACLFACFFSRSWLPVRQYSPRMDRILRIWIAGLGLALPVMAFMTPGVCAEIAVYLACASILLCLSAAAVVRCRVRSILFYACAWVALLAGALPNLLAACKLLPPNVQTLYSIRFGSAAGTLLLSVALANRFNRIRQDKLLEEKQGTLLKNLHNTTKKLTSTYNLDKLLHYTLASLSSITSCENGFILFKSGEGYTLKTSVGSGLWDGSLFTELEAEPFFRDLIREKKLVLQSDPGKSPCPLHPDIKTCIGIPVLYRDRPLALVVLYSYSFRTVTESEGEILQDFAGQVGISIENARLFSEINRMASTDGLTGVYNRTYFLRLANRHLSECWSMGKPLSLIMLDIDYFKSINDRHGHIAGDKVIQETARLLAELAQPRGIIARYGGEEFVILLPGASPGEARRLAEIMRKSVSAALVPLEQAGSVRYTISLGVASASPDTSGIPMLIDQADQALYRAKENGRNCVETFEMMESFA